MQAMLLLYAEQAAWAATGEAARNAVFGAHRACDDAPRAAGARVRTVRLAGAAPQVPDGPHAETREQLAGYDLVGDMAAALRRAARWPGAQDGSVEVPPLTHLQGAPAG